MRHLMAIVLAGIIVAHGTVGRAETRSEDTTLEQIGYGTGSVVGSIVYFPFKAAFCILGGLGGGVALVVDGAKAADRVIGASCRGTWAITPDVVKGQAAVKFVGR